MFDLMEIEEQLERQEYLLEKGQLILEDQLEEMEKGRKLSKEAGDYFYSFIQLERSGKYLEAVQDYLIAARKQLADIKALLDQEGEEEK